MRTVWNQPYKTAKLPGFDHILSEPHIVHNHYLSFLSTHASDINILHPDERYKWRHFVNGAYRGHGHGVAAPAVDVRRVDGVTELLGRHEPLVIFLIVKMKISKL